jgi:uncharacterized Zn-finger protein
MNDNKKIGVGIIKNKNKNNDKKKEKPIIMTGDRKYVCKICDAGFKRSEHLNRHILIHGKDKNKNIIVNNNKMGEFKCQICGKRSNRKDNLMAHFKTHNKQFTTQINSSNTKNNNNNKLTPTQK